MEKIQKIKFLIFFVLVGVFFSISAAAAQAASLYFSPSSGSHTVGKTFSVGVYVSSADEAMNAASGVISFPREKLEVVSLSKSGSIFNLWVLEPSFSNSAGTISFEGVVLNPGFTGSAGKIITITFRGKAIGDTSLTFSSGSVLANDGFGTNILTGLERAFFKIISAPTATPAPATPTLTVPSAPKISSPTHPDPEKWYADNSPKFQWSLPRDVSGVSVLLDKNPESNAGTRSDGLFDSYSYENLEDGTWYFYLRFYNAAGWSVASRFKFQIDTQKPEYFSINEVVPQDPAELKAKFIFDAYDRTSGISHYEIRINSGDWQIWESERNREYETSVLSPGNYVLTARAVDRAGNWLENSRKFTVKAPEPPVIVNFLRVGSWTIHILAVVIPLVALIVVLAAIIWYGWYKFYLLKKRVRKEIREAEESILKGTDLMREDTEKILELILRIEKRRELTLLEKSLKNKIENDLKKSEERMKKEIEDVKREL